MLLKYHVSKILHENEIKNTVTPKMYLIKKFLKHLKVESNLKFLEFCDLLPHNDISRL